MRGKVPKPTQTPDGASQAQAPAPLPYAAPGAHQESQWITDDQPGGGWLVGCLIAASVVGAIGAAVLAILWFFVGF
jgi:hypothetical protein